MSDIIRLGSSQVCGDLRAGRRPLVVPLRSDLEAGRGPLVAQEAARVMPRRLSSPDEALGLLRRELGPVADETRGLELRFEVPAGVRPEVVALLAHRIRLAGPGARAAAAAGASRKMQATAARSMRQRRR